MTFLQDEVALKGVMKMVETDEAGHRGRVQFIHSHVDHAGNLDIYTKSNGKPNKILLSQRRDIVRFTF